MNKERLLKLADTLALVPPENFDYEVVLEGDDFPSFDPHCGTVGCAVGHAPLAHPNELEYVKAPEDYLGGVCIRNKSTLRRLDFDHGMASDAVLEFYGLSQTQAQGLFVSGQQRYIEQPDLGSDARPTEVADLIRRFVASNS